MYTVGQKNRTNFTICADFKNIYTYGLLVLGLIYLCNKLLQLCTLVFMVLH